MTPLLCPVFFCSVGAYTFLLSCGGGTVLLFYKAMALLVLSSYSIFGAIFRMRLV